MINYESINDVRDYINELIEKAVADIDNVDTIQLDVDISNIIIDFEDNEDWEYSDCCCDITTEFFDKIELCLEDYGIELCLEEMIKLREFKITDF